ncbi:dTDP-4-amino-4,6-dideoxygalactose transaminase [Patescibacteria group bacterium]|nr:dTDP-4-amino-4,6-dideoxygalactose transaminase [Patescibacteria group bacterium]
MIPFNRPPYVGKEIEYIIQAVEARNLSGDGSFTKKCQEAMQDMFACKNIFLTTSCSSALDMAAILLEIKEGDEVIMPSYTFPSTANAFALRGARIIFVDIRSDTQNIDEALVESAITEKTKAIVVVHYAGVACDMDVINAIAQERGLYVVEDAAQGVMSTYKGRYLGTLSDIGCYSFHETKNYTCGEGGAIVVNNENFLERAEIIREKGTNRAKFFRGEIDKYSWVDVGSSYLPSELNAAYLWAQIEKMREINENRIALWNVYNEHLQELEENGDATLPIVPENCEHNGHMYYIKTNDLDTRTQLIQHLKAKKILSVFHYVPLHSSVAGKKLGTFHGDDTITTDTSERLLRLPFYYEMDNAHIRIVINTVYDFFKNN